jgi:hypothetical protein
VPQTASLHAIPRGVKWRRALIIGALAGAVVIVLMSVVAPLLGIDADLCLPVGAALGFTEWTAVAGCVAQLIVGALGGIVYAVVFEFVTQRATWWLGLLIGIGHACLAGIGVGFLFVWRQPLDGVTVPGGFMLFRGAWAAVALVVAHVVYGTIVGAGYGDVRRQRVEPLLVWKEL